MKNIRKFETTAAMDTAVLTEPYVLYNEETGLAYTNPNGGSGDNEIDYSKQYLTFEAIDDCVFAFSMNDTYYSLDNGDTWVLLSANTETPTVNAGNKILFKTTNPQISGSIGIGNFGVTGKFNISGNVMSMLYGDDFINKTDLTGWDFCFCFLFGDNDVVDTSKLILPATTLADYCYMYMFDSCENLTTAPELPATTLADYCYSNMFLRCRSLTTVPELPVTALADRCYQNMFYGCTSLSTAPELPATTLAEGCYEGMFKDCTNLTTAPELPATILAVDCYYFMFSGCTSLNHITMLATNISDTNCLYKWVKGVSSTGTFVKNPYMHSLPTGTSGIPEGWTVEDYQSNSIN